MYSGSSINATDPSRDELMEEILRYLVIHPEAKDTVRGIEKWWLSRSLSEDGKRRIVSCLEWLVARNWLLERCSAQSETIYSLNERGLPEIGAFLNARQKRTTS